MEEEEEEEEDNAIKSDLGNILYIFIGSALSTVFPFKQKEMIL
jgi:hypothetical protein